jgi:hypothetical protein
LSLDAQASLWTGLYVVYGLLIVCCWAYVARTRTAATEIAGRERSRVGARTRARWVLMAFVPSSLMLGATTFISADIAATPLLWVLPLSVYLLTFVLAFSRRPLLTVARASSALPFLAVLIALSLLGLVAVPTWGLVLLHLATLAVAGMLAHRRLFSERPPTDRMTEFYLLLSLGGVLGGVFNALVAPAVFDSVVEYPLVIVLALLLRPRPAAVRGGRPAIWALQDAIPPLLAVAAFAVTLGGVESERGRLIAASAVGLALLAFRRRPLRFAIGVAGLLALAVFSSSGGIYSDRTFFGVLRVIEDGDRRILVHGTTVHGEQRTGGSRRMEPLSYFARSGPAGDLFPDRRDRRDVDVVGLGVGSLAAYGQPGDTFTFYEIDPGVVRIASDAQLFTFLRDSPAATRVVIGDGRLSLAKAPSARIDLLVVDAFSSDAIPAHLLTREAFDLYFRRLRPDGLLALHISNRHLRLAPVIAALARDRGLAAAERYDEVGPEAHATTRLSSHWVVLARTHRQLERLLALNWRPLEPGTSRVWTDDFSNVLSVLNWH